MKKKFLLKGLLASFMLLCAAHTWAYDFKTDGIYYNILNEGNLTCEVTGRYTDSSNENAYSSDVVIPETTTYLGKTYTVIRIGYRAFYYCENLTGVTIPNSVTSIGDYAFDRCTSLAQINIPNSVTSIGDYAFSNCSSLKEVTIPNSVTSIGDYTFSCCYSLAEITIPNSVTRIGDYTLSYCYSLAEITIPNSVTSIGDYAFHSCSSLTEITIPNSVTSIGEDAFTFCTSLKDITLPNSLTSIGGSAFSRCSRLSSVTSLSIVPPTCGRNSFYEVPTSTCVLYIPLGTTKDYSEATGWKDFYNIEEIDTSGIDGIVNSGEVTEVARYSVSGQKITTPQKGINIVRYSDGTTRKILVQ